MVIILKHYKVINQRRREMCLPATIADNFVFLFVQLNTAYPRKGERKYINITIYLMACRSAKGGSFTKKIALRGSGSDARGWAVEG